MKSIRLWVLAAAVAAALSGGCKKKPPTTPTATTPTTQVTFNITNNGVYCGGSGCEGGNVYGISATRISTGKLYSQTCSIASGSSSKVYLTIPANDSYAVRVDALDADGDDGFDVWNPVTLALSSTHNMNLTGSGTSTLDSLTASSGDY